jgi:dual specificity MAP kinase phosphatase
MGFVNLSFALNTKIHLPHVKMEFSRITPGIYLGTNQCCQVHYQLELIERGVTHDISLEGEHVDEPYGADSYLWLPTEDHQAPSLTALKMGVAYIEQILRFGGQVYVHCKNGHGRSPTLVAAWFISRGKTLAQAIALIKRKRPEIHLEKSQIAALKQFSVAVLD